MTERPYYRARPNDPEDNSLKAFDISDLIQSGFKKKKDDQ